MFGPTNRVPRTKVDGEARPHARVGLSSGPPSRTDMGDYDRCAGPTRPGGVLEDLGEDLHRDKACECHCGLTPANGEDVGVRLGTQCTELPRTSLDLFVQRSE